MNLRAAAVIGIAFLVSCGSDSGTGTGPGDTPPNADAPCPEGFLRDPARPAVCREIVPAEACAAGTAPFIGHSECVPVGWTAPCPDGFVRDASGWGCADRTPAAACSGAMRESVSSDACVPIGDCNAPFPPAGALEVDDDFTAGQLDATHFQTIGAALAAAPAGAVVAVAAGRYVESVAVARSVTIVGRCAAQVTVEAPPAPATAAAGFRISGLTGVVVRGLTLHGHKNGVEVVAKSEASIEDVIVDESVGAGIFVEASQASVRRSKVSATKLGADGKWGWGVAGGLGSQVVIDDSLITGGVDGVFAASAGTLVSVHRSVIARQSPSGAVRSSGVTAASGGKVTVAQSVVRDVEGDGAVVSDQGGFLEVTESVLRGTRVKGSLARGHGVAVLYAGKAAVRSSAIVDNESVSLSAQKPGTRLEVTDSVVRGPAESHASVDRDLHVTSDRSGVGLQALEFATAKLDGVAILGAWGFGAYVQTSGALDAHHLFLDGTRALVTPGADGISFGVGITVSEAGKATLTDSTVTRGLLAGISAGQKGTVIATSVLIRDIGEAVPLGTGAGVSVGTGGTVELTRGAIDGAYAVGVLAVQEGDASVHLTDSSVHGTHVASTGFGHGAMAGPHTSFTIAGSFLFDNAAIGLALAGGSARVSGSTFAHNVIALHAQDGSFVSESADAADLSAGELRVAPDTRFVDNGTKVDNGEITLPSDPLK
jgi:hypothetical protein